MADAGEAAAEEAKVRALLTHSQTRFVLELEFVELLANPKYLQCERARAEGRARVALTALARSSRPEPLL